jgi:hypothetical protein
MASAATAFSKQNKSATVDCGFLKVKEVRPPLNRRLLRRFRLCRGDEHWPTKEAAFRKTLPKQKALTKLRLLWRWKRSEKAGASLQANSIEPERL